MAQQLLCAAPVMHGLADKLGGGAVHPGDAAIGGHAHQRLQWRVQQGRRHLKAQHQMLVGLRLQQGVFDGRCIHADHGAGVETEMLVLHHQIEHTGQAAMHVAYGSRCAAEGVQLVEVVLAVADGAGLTRGGDDAGAVVPMACSDMFRPTRSSRAAWAPGRYGARCPCRRSAARACRCLPAPAPGSVARAAVPRAGRGSAPAWHAADWG